VVVALNGRPTMHIRIEGHTDSRGSHAYNLRLSQARADSVKEYLVGKGISSDRMEAKGYGPDQPIDDNRTRAGRERNRRVEFMITQQ
jgi:OOP family OmpA-OmpF porin